MVGAEREIKVDSENMYIDWENSELFFYSESMKVKWIPSVRIEVQDRN